MSSFCSQVCLRGRVCRALGIGHETTGFFDRGPVECSFTPFESSAGDPEFLCEVSGPYCGKGTAVNPCGSMAPMTMRQSSAGVTSACVLDQYTILQSSQTRNSSSVAGHGDKYSLRNVERRPVLSFFKRVEGGSVYQKKS